MTPEELALEIRKLLLIEGNLSETQAAKLASMSQQNFSQKLKSGTLRYLEISNMLDNLNYEIVWRKKEN